LKFALPLDKHQTGGFIFIDGLDMANTVTGQLVYMGSDGHLPFKDGSDPDQTSSLFLRIVSGQDNDVQEDESKVVEHHNTRNSL